MEPMPAVEVITLGECMAAFVATTAGPLADTVDFERHIAGAEANVAVGLARLEHRVAYLGRVGADAFGTAIVRKLRGEGVDVNHVVIDTAARTGVLFRERRALGAIDVVYHRAGSAASRLGPEDVDRAVDDGVFDGARWLHLTGITPALSISARAAALRARDVARERGMTISLDVNLRRRLWSDNEAAPVLRDLAEGIDVVLGSPDELAVLIDADASSEPADLVAAVVAAGHATGVAKLGSDGALAIETGGETVRVAAIPVSQIVDPVGAGDAFCAGFIAGRLDGVDLSAALRMGNACGALAVAAAGDQAGLPDPAELARLLEAGGPDTLR
jgi:2-dehydro-3-deoxygluconokinase